MRLKQSIHPITYLKNNTAQLVRDVSEHGRSVLITQNGEAKVVVMDAATYGKWQDAMALLKILAHAESDVEAGRVMAGREAFALVEAALKNRTHEG